MNKPHKHAELIKAWADGAKIQCKSLLSRDEWLDFDDVQPLWLEHYDYRIKPEPKPDVVRYCVVSTASGYGSKICNSNLMVTFDGDSGKLKSAEVIS